MLEIAIVNGPNLNLVGTREPGIYGNQGFDDLLPGLQAKFPGVTISYYQSNVEGELINYLHGCMGVAQGIVLNAGAYTHTSIAIADAVAAIHIPTVEVHISNVYAREEYRKQSYIADKCVGSITGLGMKGYELAIQYLADRLTAETA
jgi:3-dehydroquinate dehydratase II